MSCHSTWSEFALAFQPEQLNRLGFSSRNQLISFSELGLLERIGENGNALPPYDAWSAEHERKLVDPADTTQPLEARARAYLHANCGHCHTDGGGGAVDLRLQFPVATDQMKAVGVRPTRGDFGLPGACIIKPGDACASTLYFRMAKFGRDRMPHIGSEFPDESGLKLIAAWIAELNTTEGNANLVTEGTSPAELLSDPKSALHIARQIGRNEIRPAERDRILAAAAKLPASPVRDLFEGYIACDDRGEPKLGSSPRPRTILSIKGDANRGQHLFWSKSLDCGSCHKIGDRGTSVGPDLSSIGKLRSHEDLLESILEPSRRIEPQYGTYVASTIDGRLLTGLLVKRTDTDVVLRDAQNKEVTLPANTIEQLRPSLTSIMPDGQLSALTAQQAADLLEYLSSQK